MLIPVSIVSLVFCVLGIRLLRTALQVSGAEGWLAGFFLCTAAAMPLRTVLSQDHVVVGELELMLILLSHGLMTAALCAHTLFVARVFRPDVGWAMATTACIVSIQILAPLALVFFGGHRDEQHPVVLVVGALRALPFCWGFLESVRYYGQMKKRSELGLADVVVTNRFALFAIWNGALFVLPVVLVGLRTWVKVGTESGRMLGEGVTAQMILSITRFALLALTGSAVGSLWLSFFPSRSWVERLQSRAEAAAR